MDLSKNKKGQGVMGLVSLVFGLGIAAIVIAVIVYVLATLAATGTISSNANATSAINTGVNAVQGISGWLPLIVVISVAALVISLVVGAFAFIRTRE